MMKMGHKIVAYCVIILANFAIGYGLEYYDSHFGSNIFWLLWIHLSLFLFILFMCELQYRIVGSRNKIMATTHQFKMSIAEFNEQIQKK